MTATGLSATDWSAPGAAMTAARDRARSVAADRRDALIARDRFTVDPRDDRRETAPRRPERSDAGSRGAADRAKAPEARGGTAGRAGIDGRTPGPDAPASSGSDAKRIDTAAGSRAAHPPMPSARSVDAGSEGGVPGSIDAAIAEGGGASGAKGSEGTAAATDASPADAAGKIADPQAPATTVPVVPAAPAAVPIQAGPAAAPQAAPGGGTSAEAQAAAAMSAAKGGAIGAASSTASELGPIDGDAKREGDETGAADGAGFAGVLAQAGGDTAPVAAPPPDPAAAATKADASAAPREAAPPAAPLPAAPPLPLGSVPMTIGLRALKGSSQFEIRLDPVDLGRIDVTLDIDKDGGGASARLVVDRPETLALLQRDAGSLQQALAQAGFDPGAAGISLSLRGEGTDGGGDAGARDRGGNAPSRGGGNADAAPINGEVRALRRLGGLDIRI